MIVAKLTITKPVFAQSNTADDIALPAVPTTTPSGGVVRGLGTHFISEAAAQEAQECDAEDRRIRREFGRVFMLSPIPGVYIVGDRESPRTLLASLGVDPRVNARVSCYTMSPAADQDAQEVKEWGERIKRNIAGVALGRTKDDIAADGLKSLEALATCPVLSAKARVSLLALIQEARIGSVGKPEFKRRLSALPLDVDLVASPTVAPRRGRVDRSAAIPSTEPAATA